MKDCWRNGEWNIPLRRCLSGDLISEWNELQDDLQRFQFNNDDNDQVRWALEKSHIFSTRSLYNCLTQGGEGRDKVNDTLWKS